MAANLSNEELEEAERAAQEEAQSEAQRTPPTQGAHPKEAQKKRGKRDEQERPPTKRHGPAKSKEEGGPERGTTQKTSEKER